MTNATGGRISDHDKTIADFGDQWTRHVDNPGFYGSTDLLADIVAPFIPLKRFQGARCADIGSGTGRIVMMMLGAGASSVTAIEPSRAYDVLKRNTAFAGERVTCLNVSGEQIPEGEYDLVLSIGVLHHIPDPRPVVEAAWRSLRDGGQMLVWLYGHEGTAAYRSIFLPARSLTRILPVRVNEALAGMLYPVVLAYAALATRVQFMPLHNYLTNVFMKFEPSVRRLVILDQINPQWAKYYRRDEASKLLEAAGFVDVKTEHRHGYSWSVVGTKSSDAAVARGGIGESAA